MAIRDIEAFVRQRALLFDPNLDINPGSPFDVQVVQPLKRRLGTDPFSVDLTTFVNDRLVQAFPDLATMEGDALTDLMNKPVTLLWDPMVRETRRVRRNLSFSDPSTLTLEEVDSLGANFFEERRKGEKARGPGRVFFAQPQNISISPVNFFTSKGGLRFFPREIQSIRTEEMLLNLNADGLYYFDVNLIAENAGTQYNIGPNELVSIANVPAAVRVTNRTRFGFGALEESAEEFIDRIRRELSERSLVTLRGIAAKILNNFPEVNRLNVVGFNDPEMQRDVLKGGGLGEIIASGSAGTAIADNENQALTRRFQTSEIDFQTTILGDEGSFVLTVFGAFGAVTPARDIAILRVVDTDEVDLEDQLMILGSTGLSWALRKKELTLSDIPGGIVFPDGPNGTVTVPDDEVHVGGAYDVHVRGNDFDEGTLVIDNTTDDQPLLEGTQLFMTADTAILELQDFTLDINYVEDDETYQAFERAARFGYTLQIVTGPDAGNYRVQAVVHASGVPTRLSVTPNVTQPVGSGPYRWRLFDELNIDLLEPKETRITDDDLRTVQGSDIVDTVAGTNFDEYGVAEDDVLRILGGPDAGDYTIVAPPIGPSFDKLQIESQLSQSKSDLDYLIFRPNAGGGIALPLVRIREIELLDSSSQPIGSTIPYARPVDVQTRAFQNPARGIKHDFVDVRLGLVSIAATAGAFPAIALGHTIDYEIEGIVRTVIFPGAAPTIATVISEINSQILALTGIPQIAVQVGSDRVGLRPVRGGVRAVGGTGMVGLYGANELQTSGDIRSATVEGVSGGWDALTPAIDLDTGLDVVQVLDGFNVGFYGGPFTVDLDLSGTYPGLGASTALQVGDDPAELVQFAPEAGRRVQVGARSLGSVRIYFLEPTSFEVDTESVFTLETDTGDLNFLPDPTLTYQQIPALPTDTPVQDGESAQATSTFSSASQDFVLSGIQPDDQLVITNIPIAGDVVLPDPVPALAGPLQKTLIFSLDGGPDRTLAFIRDDVSLNTDEVSRQGVVDQINALAGEDICELTGANTIRFTTARDLVIRSTGTANATILGNVDGTTPTQSFSTDDRTNESPHAGTYTIDAVAPTALTISGTFPTSSPYADPLTEQVFSVLRVGLQRIISTAMAENVAEADLFYFDVELVSEGSGDQYNIAADQQMSVVGYRSDGYYLTTDNENLTFSPAEEVTLVLSRTILEQGVDDDPQNNTQISGQNIQITYDRADLVGEVQNFLISDVERVVCSSPLGRHLIPHFVRYDLTYVGGSVESVVVPELEQQIRDLFPFDALESSDIQKVVLDRGATSVTNPIDIIAVVHNEDRSIMVARSQNALTTGRLAAFIPDVLNVVRNVTSF